MEEPENIVAQLVAFWDQVVLQITSLARPSGMIQVLVLLLCLIAAWLIRRWTAQAIHDWMRTLTGRPKWQLRLMILLHQRLRLMLFIIFAWFANGIVAQMVQFPSRRYFIGLFASIATAWLFVGLAARLVNNGLLRRIITWGLWVYVTLYFLQLLTPTIAFLDSVALSMGTFRLSLLNLVKAAIITSLFIAAARMVSRAATNKLLGNAEISDSMQVLTVKIIQFLLYFAAFFLGMKVLGFDLTGFALLSGAIGIGLGFGLQKIVSNLMSGVIILLDKSIKPGDVISLGDTFGWINELGARYVSVITRDGKEFLIPNEDMITNQVVNWSHTDDFVRLDITFKTSYAEDPHKVRKIAVEAASKVKRVLASHPAVCHITAFEDSAIEFVLRFWIRDPVQGLTNIKGNVYLALWDAFKENGIAHPFPQREVRVLNRGDDDGAGELQP